MLLFIVASFALTGVFCLLCRFANVASSPASRYLRLQIVSTVLYVFVTFLLRAIFLFSLPSATPHRRLAATLAATAKAVRISLDARRVYLANTPELRYAVEIISSPLPLLHMTSRNALEELLA